MSAPLGPGDNEEMRASNGRTPFLKLGRASGPSARLALGPSASLQGARISIRWWFLELKRQLWTRR